MSTQIKFISLGATALFCAGAWLHYMWVEWTGPAPRPLPIWSTMEQAYRASAPNADESPIGVLAKGEPVDVLWDRYGKDYWACYIKTQSGLRGWVLCTDLEMS
jgi:hypothetical protein